ncbi:restriction endonuclease subunit S [Pectinatus frisingensis]|uniref:restriction endonuclease subunit S n=1 Tax=Pectinatus frisingensis TaxID=865 RepID=UPI0018C83E76|nr:restriction endonuclease subunit S [Pectinatus frisingensis]
MIADKLRKSVLQAAIQGKLTEQLSSDGDARDLLADIQAEKKRLIKAGKIKKEKPLPDITEDEIPFDIPDNWCWVRLGEIILKVHYGYTASAQSIGNAKLLRITDIQNNFVDWGNVPYCNISEAQENEYSLQNRDIVIARTGGTIGKSFLITDLSVLSVFASYLIRVIPSHSISEIYLKYFMDSCLYWKQLTEKSQGTGQPNVNRPSLMSLNIPLPPLSEQQRIVQRLDEILSAISALEKDENKLEIIQQSFPKRMKDSLLQAAIQGNLTEQLPSDGNARDLLADIQAEKKRLIKAGKIKKEKPLPEITEDEIPFDIPDNWCWVRLGDIFQINPRNTVEDDVEASFIPMTMLDEGYISKFCYEKKLWKNIKSGFTHFSDDDIVFAKITPCFQNLKSAVMKKLVNGIGAGTTELHVLRRFTKAVDLFYTLYFLKNPIFIQDGLNTVQGTAGQQRIGKEYIKKYLFPLPPLAEQKRIVRRLEELLPKCDALNYDN